MISHASRLLPTHDCNVENTEVVLLVLADSGEGTVEAGNREAVVAVGKREAVVAVGKREGAILSATWRLLLPDNDGTKNISVEVVR